eukprot:CAMPEP_0168363546 /NCGR_PEP_ID=MMETSP0228-20121227/3745_1 /TAXON_ID=133427 /ORGANISM="Protoceratium reticulatum, Strain CCCM 535 (=CCMP 1889)" /LENGTH=132 /DNA_ID=CAMNT_0008376273 /DNA_START=209 /DNA_END=607 /DNA_ORIENTATION=+
MDVHSNVEAHWVRVVHRRRMLCLLLRFQFNANVMLSQKQPQRLIGLLAPPVSDEDMCWPHRVAGVGDWLDHGRKQHGLAVSDCWNPGGRARRAHLLGPVGETSCAVQQLAGVLLHMAEGGERHDKTIVNQWQ